MQFQASKNLKLLLIFILPLHFQSSVTAEDPTFTVCGSSNYTSGSQYETNLSAILPTLSSNGVIRSDSFYNSTYGDDPNTVYGYSQCMSAASEDVCRQCLINSTAEIIRRCPNKTEATIRYCNCILRYSDKRFFSELDTTIRFLAYPLAKVSNTSVFNAQLGGLMDGLSSAAASATSKYAQNMTRYNDFINIHGLAQCTRDLLGGDCYNCLRNMINDIPNCCDERSGGNVYSVSCNIRYETYPFLDPLPPPPAVAASPTPTGESPEMKPTQRKGNRDTSKTIVIIIPIVVLLVALSTMCAWLLIRRKKKKNQRNSETGYEEETEITMAESFSFNLSTLIAATNNFSTDNKLGQGGFGRVYKGKLSDGREIAVKRLSKRSGQGLEELLNEVALVAKLQHRNLVRLWGWCIEEQEKMLVYEYEANTSLDKFLFDPIKRVQLDLGKAVQNHCWNCSRASISS